MADCPAEFVQSVAARVDPGNGQDFASGSAGWGASASGNGCRRLLHAERSRDRRNGASIMTSVTPKNRCLSRSAWVTSVAEGLG